MLVFFQLRLMDALYDGAIQAHYLLDADLVVTGSKYKSLSSLQPFSKEQLYQIFADEGVGSVSSIYIETGTWKSPDTRLNKSILIWGVEPEEPSFKLPELKQHAQQLKRLDRILLDRGSSPQYGPIADLARSQGSVDVEINRQVVKVTGLFSLGVSFTSDENVITSDSTFLKLFAQRQANQVALRLVHLKPGVDPKVVQEQLRDVLGIDFKVFTVPELRDAEKHFWESHPAITAPVIPRQYEVDLSLLVQTLRPVEALTVELPDC